MFLNVKFFLKGDENMKFKEDFNIVIKDLRKKKNLTQRELAKETGISFSMITKYEQGLNTPSIENLRKLADFFGGSISEFVVPKTKKEFLGHLILSDEDKIIDIDNYDFNKNEKKFKKIAGGREYIYHILKFLECAGFEIYIDIKKNVFNIRSEDPAYAINCFLTINNFQFFVQFLRNILIDYSYKFFKEFSDNGKFSNINNLK